MDDRQLFKIAYIEQCISEGITTPEGILKKAQADLESYQSRELVTSDIQQVPSKTASLLGDAASLGVLASIPALAAPPLLGGALGYMGAKVTDIDDTDAEIVRQEDLLNHIRQNTERLQRHNLSKQVANMF